MFSREMGIKKAGRRPYCRRRENGPALTCHDGSGHPALNASGPTVTDNSRIGHDASPWGIQPIGREMGVCEAGLDTGYDAARTDLAVIGTIGKRLTYRRTDEAYV